MAERGVPKGMTVRELRIEDYDALIRLWEAAGLRHRPDGRDGRGRIGKELGSPMAVFLVAELEGRLIGSLLGTTDGRKGWINRLAVHPDFQRRGVARALLREAEERFERRGLLVFACLIEGENAASQEFFDRMGYDADRTVVYFSKRKGKAV